VLICLGDRVGSLDHFRRPVILGKCHRCGCDLWSDTEDAERSKQLSSSPVFLCRECNGPFSEEQGFASEISDFVIRGI
jgi:hypothetical protein